MWGLIRRASLSRSGLLTLVSTVPASASGLLKAADLDGDSETQARNLRLPLEPAWAVPVREAAAEIASGHWHGI